MRAWTPLVLRITLIVTAVVLALSALAPVALAQSDTATSCGPEWESDEETNRPLAANGGHLLTRDGTGFFTDNVRSIAVRSAHSSDAVLETTNAISQELIDFYFGTDVEIFVNQPGASTRAVLIDGDISVPGQPTVFTIGGVATLYLHWTTAQADIANLLDIPAFATFASSDESTSCAQPAAALDEEPNETAHAEAPPANPDDLGEEPADVLAYVDDDADEPTESASPVGNLVVSPLADATSTQTWPLGVTAAAVIVTTGGVVLSRRDKIWGDRFAPEQPAEVLIEASRPKLPVADLPPAQPRVIFLDEADAPSANGAAADSSALRQIDLHAQKTESPLTKLVEKVAVNNSGPVLAREEFARTVTNEWTRHQSGGDDGAVASLVLSELQAVRLRLGNNAADQLFDEVADKVAEVIRPLDVIGLAGPDELAILMPDVSESGALRALDDIAKCITAATFTAVGERVLLTPATGFALLSDTKTAPDLIRAVESARALSMLNLHLDPERWDGQLAPAPAAKNKVSTWAGLKERLRTPSQIALTFVIAWVIPFLAYWGFHELGLNITFLAYLFVVMSLVITGAFILGECFMAVKQKEPPELPPEAYPKATALIAAYMPNEAATVIETIESFLAIDYPNELQIILAYNTPDPLPVEEHLDRIAAEHPNFMPVRIVGSNSKAQNVNAALSMAEGEFIGMFDADHQPRPDAFTRAWRWIEDGYDVVQGHCLTRNGDAGFLAKMIAVEFESIYAVAHPGRAKMHRFGVFGGSNGFWRTELLHETRMRGSMLTEDIDSSMRVVERGFKIRSDRDLVSRELATTTFQQIWNQRMRWAQGWFQVSMEHAKFAVRAKELTIRQKLGIFHLLMWREVYPWLSMQLFPLIAFWSIQSGGIENLDWKIPIFVATSIFTFSVGPLQTVFAYRLADPEIKQHKKWFWAYLLFTTPFYTEYKNLIARVAHVKQFMGESDWRVTPRSAD